MNSVGGVSVRVCVCDYIYTSVCVSRYTSKYSNMSSLLQVLSCTRTDPAATNERSASLDCVNREQGNFESHSVSGKTVSSLGDRVQDGVIDLVADRDNLHSETNNDLDRSG
jgi:hypothetical protein